MSFQEDNYTGKSGFRKHFYDCTCDFQENQQKLVRLFIVAREYLRDNDI